jgi:hypothetical protein
MATHQVSFLDNRGTIIKELESLISKCKSGQIQAIGLVALHDNGDFSIHEASRNNTDRLALVGATQVLSQHIMAGE